MTAPARPVVVVADCYLTDANEILQLVSHSCHGAEAVQCIGTLSSALRTHQPDIAVVGVRFQEERNILDVLPALRVISPRTRFILATAYPGWAPAGRAFALGARGYIAKPVEQAQLIKAIEVAHAGGVYFMDHHVVRATTRILGLTRPLSEQQHKVFSGLRQKLTYREIGEQLGISESTVGKHVHVIREKLGIAEEGAYVRWEHIVCPSLDGMTG